MLLTLVGGAVASIGLIAETASGANAHDGTAPSKAPPFASHEALRLDAVSTSD